MNKFYSLIAILMLGVNLNAQKDDFNFAPSRDFHGSIAPDTLSLEKVLLDSLFMVQPAIEAAAESVSESSNPHYDLAGTTQESGKDDYEEFTSIEEGIEIAVYPNPTIDRARIDLLRIEKGNWTAQLINSQGANVFVTHINLFQDDQRSIEMDTSSLESGMYILSVRNDQGIGKSVRIYKK